MERIKEAVRLANALKLRAEQDQSDATKSPVCDAANGSLTPQSNPKSHNGIAWNVRSVELDTAHLERERIVSHSATHRSHVAFNVLRTKLSQILSSNAWKTVAITSPTPGCGKTMVSLNLAFSLARQSNCRTVLIDLDLRKSSVARALGVAPQRSIGQYLDGQCDLKDCFVSVNENLFFGLNDSHTNRTTELAQLLNSGKLIEELTSHLDPHVILVDLPPILSNDDVITFLPHVDCGFLVAASGKTTAKEIEECEAEFTSAANFLGVVLNRCTDLSEDYYQYSQH